MHLFVLESNPTHNWNFWTNERNFERELTQILAVGKRLVDSGAKEQEVCQSHLLFWLYMCWTAEYNGRPERLPPCMAAQTSYQSKRG